jgi:acyl-CoA synthetase (AMP-forming)/AMP-acid ligase II
VRFEKRGAETDHFSYREILSRATRVAVGLREAGVETRDRVALAVPTGIEFYDGFFGALLAGAIPVALPLPPRFGSRDSYVQSAAAMLEAVRARVVLSNGGDRATLTQAADAASTKCECIEAKELEVDSGSPDGGTELPSVGPDDLAVAQFSSGTTSSPKAVALTHRQVIANVDAILDAILTAYPESESGHGSPSPGAEGSAALRHAGVSWLPLYHDMGLVGAFLTALRRPGPLTLLTPEVFIATPARWLRAISDHKATISAAPNFAYDYCVDRVRDKDLEGVDLSSWLVALNGSETVVPETIERFYERFRGFGLRKEAITPVYGLAEASLAVTFTCPRSSFREVSFDREALVREGLARPVAGAATDRSAIRLPSAGTALSGMAVRIGDHEGDELAECKVGRVLIRGPSVAERYLGGSGESKIPRYDDFYDTGDRGFVHKGELFLVGRDSDRIVIRGRNYTPEMFESACDGVEDIRPASVAAIGVVGERGDALYLLVETTRKRDEEATAVLEKSLRSRLVETIGVAPDRVIFLARGALPRTSSGKVRRGEAARRFLNGKEAQADSRA